MHSKLNPLAAPFYTKAWQPTQIGKGKGKQKMQMPRPPPPPPPPPPPQQHDQQFRPCHIVNPREGHPHAHTIIFLHGRDSTAEDFASELFESEASAPADGPPTDSTPGSRTLPNLLPTVKWVFPRAPILRSARFGTDMSQWFDIWSVEDPSEGPDLQVPGLKQSIEYIHSVIDAEAALIPGGRSKIFLAGISQGFATALASFYAPPKNWSSQSGAERNLAGLIGISTWLPFARPLRNFWDWTQANSNTGKFVLNHGNTSGSLDHLEVPHRFMRLVGKFFTNFPGVEIERLLKEDPSTQEELFHFDQLASFEQLVAETQQEEEAEEARHEEAKANFRSQGRWEEYQRVEQEFKERKYKSTQEMGKTPMHLQHCEDDAVVPVGSVREMSDALRGIMWRVESQIYKDGGHWVNEPAGVDDFVKFVKRNM